MHAVPRGLEDAFGKANVSDVANSTRWEEDVHAVEYPSATYPMRSSLTPSDTHTDVYKTAATARVSISLRCQHQRLVRTRIVVCRGLPVSAMCSLNNASVDVHRILKMAAVATRMSATARKPSIARSKCAALVAKMLSCHCIRQWQKRPSIRLLQSRIAGCFMTHLSVAIQLITRQLPEVVEDELYCLLCYSVAWREMEQRASDPLQMRLTKLRHLIEPPETTIFIKGAGHPAVSSLLACHRTFATMNSNQPSKMDAMVAWTDMGRWRASV